MFAIRGVDFTIEAGAFVAFVGLVGGSGARWEEGAFREEFYYRIHVIQIKVRPLRERREDILWFTHRFLDEQSARGERKRLSRAADEALLAHASPGNIRELLHAIERASILTPGQLLEPETLFEESGSGIGRQQGTRPLPANLRRAAPPRIARFRAVRMHMGTSGNSIYC